MQNEKKKLPRRPSRAAAVAGFATGCLLLVCAAISLTSGIAADRSWRQTLAPADRPGSPINHMRALRQTLSDPKMKLTATAEETLQERCAQLDEAIWREQHKTDAKAADLGMTASTAWAILSVTLAVCALFTIANAARALTSRTPASDRTPAA
jgi:hypothetical protein